MPFVIAIHVLVCFLLIVLVLIQRGRGGGLLESFSGVESMFGTKTNEFLTRMTTVLSILFFITCLGLAVLAVRQSRSLIPKTAAPAPARTAPVTKPAAAPVSGAAASQAPAATQTPNSTSSQNKTTTP